MSAQPRMRVDDVVLGRQQLTNLLSLNAVLALLQGGDERSGQVTGLQAVEPTAPSTPVNDLPGDVGLGIQKAGGVRADEDTEDVLGVGAAEPVS